MKCNLASQKYYLETLKLPVATLVSARDCQLRHQSLENTVEIPKESCASKQQTIPGLNLGSKRPNIKFMFPYFGVILYV